MPAQYSTGSSTYHDTLNCYDLLRARPSKVTIGSLEGNIKVTIHFSNYFSISSSKTHLLFLYYALHVFNFKFNFNPNFIYIFRELASNQLTSNSHSNRIPFLAPLSRSLHQLRFMFISL